MRKFIINVNGNSYEVEVEEVGEGSPAPERAQTTARPSPAKEAPKAKPAASPKAEPKAEVQASGGQETVEAPMPGNIWKLMVKEGDTVKEGDVLLILEAMKMENEILSPITGRVVGVNTSEGSTVAAGDKLIILE